MKDFKAIANNTKTESDGLFKDRKRHKLEDMLKMYPNGFTVVEFRKLMGPKGPFWLFGYREDPTSCFGGSLALDRIAEAWTENGDVIATSDELNASGGVKMKLKVIKTRTGNDYYDVEIVD